MRRKYKEGELDAARRQMEERRRHEEDLEIQRMRREAVHKAQPVRHFNPIDIQKCDKPVTVPVTPQFTYVERNKRKGLTEEQEKITQ
jgi:targeting protein for Xklp2